MRPAGRLLWMLGCLVGLAVVWPGFGYWAVLTGGSMVLLAIDGLLCRRKPVPDVQRRLATSLAVDRPTQVTLVLSNQTTSVSRIRVFDETPAGCEVDAGAFGHLIELGPDTRHEVVYQLVPLRRGVMEFGQLVVLQRSPLGFWEARFRLPAEQSVRVYPDFSIIASYLDMLAGQQAVQLGIRLAPRRGEGLEFHQLREYRSGDSIRQIDWKATARRRELISREYTEERDQRVLFLIDSGRRMRASDGRLSHFDYALNAMLLLAYVALRQGDSVALRVFGHEQRWVSPRRGVASVNTLLNETFDLHTGTDAADYLGVAEDVMVRQPKRSLIVLLTNLREEDAELGSALKLLRKRHVVLIGNLRERVLDETSEVIPRTFTEALRVAGTHGYLQARRAHHVACGSLAHMLVDCIPEELPVSVVNAYWQVKRSGVL